MGNAITSLDEYSQQVKLCLMPGGALKETLIATPDMTELNDDVSGEAKRIYSDSESVVANTIFERMTSLYDYMKYFRDITDGNNSGFAGHSGGFINA